MHPMRKLPVVPICRTYPRLLRRANQNDLLAHPASMKRDVRAIVTTRGAGMRWTRRARQTNVACADGEVAWSRPPDAEVKLAMMLCITPMTGARKPGPRGDRDISLKTIAQGMPVDPAEPVVTAACFFCCRRAMGEVITRHSLRPLRFPRATLFAALGRERVAGSRSCVQLKVVLLECRQGSPSPRLRGRDERSSLLEGRGRGSLHRPNSWRLPLTRSLRLRPLPASGAR